MISGFSRLSDLQPDWARQYGPSPTGVYDRFVWHVLRQGAT